VADAIDRQLHAHDLNPQRLAVQFAFDQQGCPPLAQLA
jgi:hypothetical protein